ncbi:MAG: RNA polymerase sigma factor [Parcubacteria bacterium C7867-006]|nr:MAG: RNA polymerase sigma factor [Parcubacteria bacterium C7867-006]
MPNKVLEKMFLEAYQSHSDSIFRFIIFKIDNRERALDLTQETFMKTWIHISKNGELENIRAFLYKVAGNLVIDEYRKRGKKDYNTDSLETMSEDGFEPTSNVDELESIVNKLDGEKIMGLVQTLPEMYSDILFMKYNEDLSISEMADSLDVSQNVVSVRLNRAIKKLKDLVSSEIKKYEN